MNDRPIMLALALAQAKFYTENGHNPDYFAMSAGMVSLMCEEAGTVARYPVPLLTGAKFNGIAIMELPFEEGIVAACGSIAQSREPYVFWQVGK